MSGTFQGINIASTALAAFQQALEVTGNNITNVSTPGYSRQVANFSPLWPSTQYGMSGPFSVGNGVSIASVNRIQDAFLAARKLVSLSDLGKANTLSTSLQQVESLATDTSGTGISNSLDSFFNAWSALASNPGDPAQLAQVQMTGSTLASQIQSAYTTLSSYAAQMNGDVGQTIQDINTQANQIASLNAQIAQQVAAGNQPNNLLDQRDQAIQALSTMVNIHVVAQSNGMVNITMDQMNLVDQGGAHTFPANFDAASGTVTGPKGSYSVTSGQLAGLFQSLSAISGYQSQLDSLADNLRTQVNTLYQGGTNLQGTTGQNFFNTSTGAATFGLDPAIQASAQNIAFGTSGNSGDGGLALQLSQLRGSPVAALGNITIGQYYTNFVAQIGRDSATYQTTAQTQAAVGQQIDSQIQSVSGVSLDDEMTNMLRFQRSYEAAARALSIFDQTTETLISMIP